MIPKRHPAPAVDLAIKGVVYECPGCGNGVWVKGGDLVNLHFCHRPGSTCKYYTPCNKGNRRWKTILYGLATRPHNKYRNQSTRLVIDCRCAMYAASLYLLANTHRMRNKARITSTISGHLSVEHIHCSTSNSSSLDSVNIRSKRADCGRESTDEDICILM